MSVEDFWFQWVNQYFNPTRKFVFGHLTLQKPFSQQKKKKKNQQL